MISLRALAMMMVAVATAPAGAQLVSETVRDTTRLCTYAGTQTLPDGEVVPNGVTVGLGQNCPSTAPYHDPNAPVPPNAALLGERVTAQARFCRYGEGGVEYQVPVDLTLACAMTPALLRQAQEAAERDIR